ncbi:MAG: hypothetical protein RL885_29290 [Planctomycetota bacterium]
MWARVVEVLLACWLGVSPFVIPEASRTHPRYAVDYTAALLVAGFSLFACVPRRGVWRMGTFAVGLGIAVAGWCGLGNEAGAQNLLSVGLLLAMFAVIPTQASELPRSWKSGEEHRDSP